MQPGFGPALKRLVNFPAPRRHAGCNTRFSSTRPKPSRRGGFGSRALAAPVNVKPLCGREVRRA